MELKSHQSFFRQFTALYRPFIQRAADVLEKDGLTVPQWSTLRLIAEVGEMTPAELAGRQHVEKPTVSNVLQQLQSQDLISTKQGRDRREKVIMLTKQGHELYTRTVAEVEKLEREVIGDISEEEQNAMTERFIEIQRRL